MSHPTPIPPRPVASSNIFAVLPVDGGSETDEFGVDEGEPVSPEAGSPGVRASEKPQGKGSPQGRGRGEAFIDLL